MKYLKMFNESISYGYIKFVCEKYDITNYTINDDMSIDVDGDVSFWKSEMEELPLKFGKVSGSFDCSDNKLTTLKGSPYYIGTDFDCSNNKLTSLEFSPKKIECDFNCCGNKITTLEGGPEYVGYTYYFSDNEVTSLRGLPEDINNFDAGVNPIDKYWFPITKKFSILNSDSTEYMNKLEIFLYMDIDTLDGDEICQQKLGYILNN